jgi:hypothetical protein
MNKKRGVVVFLIVAVLGIFTINEFLFPMYRYDCSCLNGYIMADVICEEHCPDDGSCNVNHSYSGQCIDFNCVWDIYYFCVDSGTDGRDNWTEWSCWDCVIW